MATLKIDGDELTLQLSMLERIGALVPAPKARLDQVETVHFIENLWTAQLLQGVRAPGTGFPYVVMIGVMRRLKTKDFCVIKRKKPGVVITFSAGPYQRWIYTLEGSRHAEDQILASLTRKSNK
jgi:hypothetical protein